jgi:hypothetical protein
MVLKVLKLTQHVCYSYTCAKLCMVNTEWSKSNIPCCARQVRATFHDVRGLHDAHTGSPRILRVTCAGCARHIRESDANATRGARNNGC